MTRDRVQVCPACAGVPLVLPVSRFGDASAATLQQIKAARQRRKRARERKAEAARAASPEDAAPGSRAWFLTTRRENQGRKPPRRA